MEGKHLAIIGMILTLLLGIFGTMAIMPTKEIIKEVEKECPVCNPEVINNTEIIYEKISYLDSAIDEFMDAVEEDDEISILGHYNFDEVSIKKIYDEYRVVYLDDDEYFIKFGIDLKFKEDGESSDLEHFNVKVTYEDDEEPKVEIL